MEYNERKKRELGQRLHEYESMKGDLECQKGVPGEVVDESRTALCRPITLLLFWWNIQEMKFRAVSHFLSLTLYVVVHPVVDGEKVYFIDRRMLR